MRHLGGPSFGKIVAGSSLILLLFTCPTWAQDPKVAELRIRLDKLEKEQAELEEARKQQGGLAAPASGLKDTDVKKIVGDYLKEQDDKKKQADAAKKLEAQEKGVEVGSDLKMSANWNSGLVLQTENKDFRLHLGGRFDDYWVWWNEAPALKRPPASVTGAKAPFGVGTLEDGTFFRRARLSADGNAWEVYEFAMEFDFESLSPITFNDLWFGMTQVPVLGTVRVGNQKVPQGLESYSSEKYLTFMERGAIFDAFLSNFQPGLFATNSELDQHLTWAAMLYRPGALISTRASGTSNDTGTGAEFGNGDIAGTARVTGLPYYEADGRYLLHLGASYTYRTALTDNTATNGTLTGTGRETVQFRTRPELFDSVATATNSNSNRFLDTGLFGGDSTQVFGGELLGIVGPFSVQGEYVLANVNNAYILPTATTGPKSLGDPTFQGFYILASYFLTGENRAYDRRFGRLDRLKPFTNFWWVRTEDGTCRGCGAWEVAARYSVIDFNDNRMAIGTAGQLNEYAVALNWYLNPNMKIQWNYVRINREVSTPNASGDVDGFGMQFHIDF